VTFLIPSGSCSVRDRARVRHNTSWSTDKPDQEGAPSSVLPYDCSLTRSLARSLHILLLFFTATTYASGSGAKERPCMLRTIRYFGIDKDGKTETLKDGSSTWRKTDSRVFFLTLATSFSLVFERKIHHVHAFYTHVVCPFGRFVLCRPGYRI